MAETSERPREVAALYGDVVGYSRLMADDSEATAATMDELRHLVAERVSAGGGTLVHFAGDSFMSVFDDAGSAVSTAITLTAEIESRNDRTPRSRRARFRMGVDQGPVTVIDGQYHGDALNIAARIQAIAPPGGLSVSGLVYRALDEPALRFRAVGRHGLKNIPEEVEVYEFVDLPSQGAATAEGSWLSLEAPTVAVLPIHAETVDEPAGVTARILREDLIHRLAKVPQLRVVNADAEPGGGAPATTRYMIESGAHQAGDRIRIYATLIDVTTMNVVKSHRWTTTVDDLFALSDIIADEVARSVEVELIVGAPAGLYADLADPAAIENIYLGWYHLTTGTREGWSRALALFSDVARSHPEQPYGHALAGFANWMGASYGLASDPEQALADALASARPALGIGDPTGMAQTVVAAVHMSQGRAEEAAAALEEAKISRPTCDATFGLEGSVRRYMGQWEKAVDLLDAAMRLTAVNKPWYPTVKACSLFMGGRAEQAASVAEGVLQYQPSNLEALLVLAAAQVEIGLDRRARATAELIRERFPSVDVEDWLDKNPYQDRDMVARWKADLTSAGAIRKA